MLTNRHNVAAFSHYVSFMFCDSFIKLYKMIQIIYIIYIYIMLDENKRLTTLHFL